jgi:G3E family GTPase
MTPLVLLVGFLGAGKTTLLRALIQGLKDKGRVPLVVINDYQNARVDAALLEELTAHVQPISGSCVCCGSREQLLDTLNEMPAPERAVLLLESNGTTDAEELIELLSLAPQTRRFTPPMQISVIDAKRWQKRFWHNALEKEQVRTAAWIYPTRQSEVPETRWNQVRKAVAELCPGATWGSTDEILNALDQTATDVESMPSRELDSESFTRWDRGAHTREHAHTQAYHFASIEFQLPPVVRREAFDTFLSRIPPEVVRAKGLVAFQENPDVMQSFQFVGDPPVPLLLPLPHKPKKGPAIIFIGGSLPRVTLSILVETLKS